MNRALFLDRDGVINYDFGFVYEKENFIFCEDIFNLAREAIAKGYKVVVITNQSGIARGYFSEEQFHKLNNWMCQKFLEEGAPIERTYFSPYHPTEGFGTYLKDESTRKPNPGMIMQAQNDLSLSLDRSILVGDKISDIQAGNNAGVGTNLLLGSTTTAINHELNYELINNIREVSSYL